MAALLTHWMNDTKNRFLRQFILYGICGVAATVVHVIIFHLSAWQLFPALESNDLAVHLLHLPITEIDVATRSVNSMISNGIAFIFSTGTAYVLNIMWVFKPGRHNRFVEIGLFYAVSGISVLMGTGLMGLLIRLFHARTTYAFALNIVFSVAVNFLVRKYLIFKE